MLVVAQHQEALRQLGLDTLEGVKRYTGDLIKNHKGQRDIQRIRTAANGHPLVLFKRNWKPYKKDGFSSLLTRGVVWSQSRTEWENLLALQKAGLSVAGPGGLRRGVRPALGKVLIHSHRLGRGRNDSRRVSKELSGRRGTEDGFHGAGADHSPDARRLINSDPFTRHLFLTRGPVPKFCLIDMALMDRKARLSPARFAPATWRPCTSPPRCASSPKRSGNGSWRTTVRRSDCGHLFADAPGTSCSAGSSPTSHAPPSDE